MKYILTSLLASLFILKSSAQNFDKWRAGSALELKGKIYILSIFVTIPDKKWDYDEKIKITAMQLMAQDWLVKEAKNYNVNISFENGFYGVKNDIVIDTIKNEIVSFEKRADWVYRLLTRIGYSSPQEFLDKLKVTSSCSNSLVIIYPNQRGRSYAVPFNTDRNAKEYFLEGCVVFKSYKAYRQCAPTLAHEILHLFGAWDLYYEKNRYDKEKAKHAWELYPKDIMLQHSADIDDSTIDDLTAWLVGLTTFKDKEFEWFRPDYRMCE